MNKILIFSAVIFALVGCTEPIYHEDPEVTKKVLKNYDEKLKKAKVKFLKCYPDRDGKMRAVYTTIMRDNSFPATIRFDYINKGFNMYFDKSYLNGQKKDFLDDVNACMVEWEKLKDAKKSWK